MNFISDYAKSCTVGPFETARGGRGIKIKKESVMDLKEIEKLYFKGLERSP